jgi:hypothetical protein
MPRRQPLGAALDQELEDRQAMFVGQGAQGFDNSSGFHRPYDISTDIVMSSCPEAEASSFSPKSSDKPTFRQRHADTLADDDVIEQPYVHQGERLLDALGDQFVGLARLGDAGGVLGFIS